MGIFDIIESIVFVGAMFFYIRHAVVSNFAPNPIAFAIWLVADIVSLFTYSRFSVHIVAPIIMVLGACTIVMIGVLRWDKSKKSSKLMFLDWFAIVVSVLSLGVYIFTDNVILSNIIIQVIMFTGFIPIIEDVVVKKNREPLLSWSLFVVGWLITIIYTYIGYENIAEMVYPLVNEFGCLIVLWLSFLLPGRKSIVGYNGLFYNPFFLFFNINYHMFIWERNSIFF